MKKLILSRRSSIKALALGGAMMMPAIRRASAEPIKLKLATPDSPADTTTLVAQRFGADIAKRTDNKYDLQIFLGGSLGTGLNLGTALQTGIIDCAMLTSGFLESLIPSVQVIDLPFLFKDVPTAERILDGDVGQKLFDDMEARNIIGLIWGWNGWRTMQTREKKVTTPDDLKGLKMRIQPGPVFAAMFKAVGAIPVPLDGSEVYLALSQKTVDGVEFPLPTVQTFKAYEVTKYLALTRHVYNAGALMVSKTRWDQMTPADRDAFRAAAKGVLPLWRTTIAERSESAAAFVKEKGMIISETDFKAFQAKMTPLFGEFRPKYQELFDKIMAQQA